MTDPFVVDCSVTASWLFADERDQWGQDLLASLQTREAVAPALWVLETANVLLVAERRGRLSRAEAVYASQLLLRLPILVEDSEARALEEILALGQQTGLSAYDAVYLDLAQRSGLPLATRDAALREAARTLGVPLL